MKERSPHPSSVFPVFLVRRHGTTSRASTAFAGQNVEVSATPLAVANDSRIDASARVFSFMTFLKGVVGDLHFNSCFERFPQIGGIGGI